jgi:hypothetical protein
VSLARAASRPVRSVRVPLQRRLPDKQDGPKQTISCATASEGGASARFPLAYSSARTLIFRPRRAGLKSTTPARVAKIV